MMIASNQNFCVNSSSSTAVLHRCIPTGHEAIQEAYDIVNSWSIAQQLFNDLYTTWPTIVMMCFAAFSMSTK